MSLLNTAVNLLMAPPPGAAGYSISRSLRFNSSDSAYCSRLTWGTPTDRRRGTISMWAKRASFGTTDYIIYSYNGSAANSFGIYFDSDNTLEFQFGGASAQNIRTSAVFRDPSAWYHLVFAWDTTDATPANRVKIYVNNVQQTIGTTNYPSQNVEAQFPATTYNYIGFNSTSTFDGYLADVIFVDGQQLTPSSFTEVSATTGQLIPKAYTGTFGTNGFWLKFSDNSAATATTLGKDYSPNGNNWTPNNLVTSQTIGMPSGYSATGYSGTLSNIETDDSTYIDALSSHIDFDLGAVYTVGTVTLKFKSYDNTCCANYRIELYSNSGFTTLLANSSTSSASSTILTLTHDFGSTSARYLRLSYQGGGRVARVYYLSTTGATRTVTVNTDSLVDTPTSYGTDTGAGGEVRGNYATLNPLNGSSNGILTNGNLDYSSTVNSTQRYATIGVSSGKWYWETTLTSTPSGISNLYGPGISDKPLETGASYTGIRIYIHHNGNKFDGSTLTESAYGSAFTNGDTIGIALNLDAGTLTFYKNGVSQGVAFSGLTGTWFPVIRTDASASGSWNFGQRPFAYTAPSGFKALCDTNLPAPVVAKPNTVMDVKLYTGNGSSQTISGVNFSPDFIWLKARSSAFDHGLIDIVRGAGNYLVSNSTAAEASGTTAALTSDGFTLGGGFNNNGVTYVSWMWDAGSSTVTNTQGSITGGAQVRANPSAGFSIITFTMGSGSYTVGHGLNTAPSLLITKARSNTSSWWTYHASLGTGSYLALNSTAAAASDYSWGSAPTSTVFTANNNFFTNGYTYVVYAFSPVAGYSSVSSYVGSGSADGPFVYTGFRPKFIMVKRSDASGEPWVIHDSVRDFYNGYSVELYPNNSNAEGGPYSPPIFDFLSNGFKIRSGTATAVNASGGTFIYMALAESPFQYARAR